MPRRDKDWMITFSGWNWTESPMAGDQFHLIPASSLLALPLTQPLFTELAGISRLEPGFFEYDNKWLLETVRGNIQFVFDSVNSETNLISQIDAWIEVTDHNLASGAPLVPSTMDLTDASYANRDIIWHNSYFFFSSANMLGLGTTPSPFQRWDVNTQSKRAVGPSQVVTLFVQNSPISPASPGVTGEISLVNRLRVLGSKTPM